MTGGHRHDRTRRGLPLRLLRALSLAVATIFAFGGAAPAVRALQTPAWPGDAPYSVRRTVLDAALECATPITGAGRKQPVLLVHGTGVSPEANWSWNYIEALRRAGFEVCWVTLPDDALSDIQISAEYVARAVQVMTARAGERIDLLAHSQGGVVARWAARWFRSAVRMDDVVMVASPNHGTAVADIPTMLMACFESCWQMRRRANLIAALNRDDESPGTPSYTAVYTSGDEIVRPPKTAAVAGGANIMIQDLCPARPVGHVSVLGDGAVYEIVLDALARAGPARPARLPPDLCTRTLMPGTSYIPNVLAPNWTGGRVVNREPPLKPYARG